MLNKQANSCERKERSNEVTHLEKQLEQRRHRVDAWVKNVEECEVFDDIADDEDYRGPALLVQGPPVKRYRGAQPILNEHRLDLSPKKVFELFHYLHPKIEVSERSVRRIHQRVSHHYWDNGSLWSGSTKCDMEKLY